MSSARKSGVGIMTLERIFILKTTRLFSDVSGNILAELVPFLKEINLDPEEILLRKGDVIKSLYIIVEGKIRIHDGEHTKVILEKRETFCELAALSTEICSNSISAEEETQIFQLDQDILYELMAESPQLAKTMIQILTKRFL